jgi:hypothetical protein
MGWVRFATRLRQPPSSEGGLRRLRGFGGQHLSRRVSAEASAKADSNDRVASGSFRQNALDLSCAIIRFAFQTADE